MSYNVKLVDYFDVWGNAEEGFEVNNLAYVDEFELPQKHTTEMITDILIEREYLSEAARGQIEYDSLGELGYEGRGPDGQPLFRVEINY